MAVPSRRLRLPRRLWDIPALLWLLFAWALAAAPVTASASATRDVVQLNRSWMFQLGDPPKAGSTDYRDDAWQPVHLPHSFSLPYFLGSGFYVGHGWYRKQIQIGPEWQGKRIALGDVNSTSSFNVPVAMMMEGGVKPWADAKTLNMAGSHANVLNALNEGLADVGGASFDSFEKAVNAKAIDPNKFKVVAKSTPIPYPPLAIHPKVNAEVKAKLRTAFDTVHTMPGITKDQIRGYGGTRVDAYTSKVSEEDMANAGKLFDLVTENVKQDLMAKASKR